MTANLNRPAERTERRQVQRRAGADRRIAGFTRRRSDRTELTSVTDEDEVRLRMHGRGEESRIRHEAQVRTEARIMFGQVDPQPPTLRVRWWALLAGLWGRK